MKLKTAADDPVTGLSKRYVSEQGLVQVGLFKVLYGFRVRAGFTDDEWGVTLDWCAGPNPLMIGWLQGVLLAILDKREEDDHCFRGLPSLSGIKPYYKDPEFLEALTRALDDPARDLVREVEDMQPLIAFADVLN